MNPLKGNNFLYFVDYYAYHVILKNTNLVSVLELPRLI